MIDEQERNKVWNIMIIYRSVAVSLPLDGPRCGVTTSEVDWMSCCNHYVTCVTWQTQCIHYPGLYFRLGRCQRQIWKKLSNGAQCHFRNLVQLFLFLDSSLRVLYLTMLLAQHRQVVTDNRWSINGKEVVSTLSIDESWDTYNINDISMANGVLKLWQSILDQWQWGH